MNSTDTDTNSICEESEARVVECADEIPETPCTLYQARLGIPIVRPIRIYRVKYSPIGKVVRIATYRVGTPKKVYWVHEKLLFSSGIFCTTRELAAHKAVELFRKRGLR